MYKSSKKKAFKPQNHKKITKRQSPHKFKKRCRSIVGQLPAKTEIILKSARTFDKNSVHLNNFVSFRPSTETDQNSTQNCDRKKALKALQLKLRLFTLKSSQKSIGNLPLWEVEIDQNQ